MPPKEENKPAPAADADEEFFKTHGVENDDDKNYLKSAWLREEYMAHKRKAAEDGGKPAKKKGLFGGRRD